MQVINVQRSVILCAAVLLGFSLTANVAFAQPGAPAVTVFPDNSVQVSYVPVGTPPADTVLVVTYNGALAGQFPIGTVTSVHSGVPVPTGFYTVQVVWGPGVSSPITTFVVLGGGGAPGPTTMLSPIIVGNTVTLTWDASANATFYELQVVIFETGQTFTQLVGNQTSVTVPNVPVGNYLVRVRGRNASGAGAYSNQVLVNVALTFRLRDMEVSLTWNSLSDMDLHVIEPNGAHVYWRVRNGVTARLDRDNTTGFGPETISVDRGLAAPGIYQIFIVHYRGAAPTTSTIAVTLDVGTPSARTVVLTRQTEQANAALGYNVALVDLQNRVVGEAFGTRPIAPTDEGDEPLVKPQ